MIPPRIPVPAGAAFIGLLAVLAAVDLAVAATDDVRRAVAAGAGVARAIETFAARIDPGEDD